MKEDNPLISIMILKTPFWDFKQYHPSRGVLKGAHNTAYNQVGHQSKIKNSFNTISIHNSLMGYNNTPTIIVDTSTQLAQQQEP